VQSPHAAILPTLNNEQKPEYSNAHDSRYACNGKQGRVFMLLRKTCSAVCCEDYADSVEQGLLNVSRVTSIYVGPFLRNPGLGLLTNPSFAQSFDAFLLSG